MLSWVLHGPGQLWMQAIDQLDGACTNADDQMLVRQRSRDRVMS